MGCRLNKLMKSVFFLKVMVRMFFMKKYLPAEYVFIFQLFPHITFFSDEHSVFLGQLQFAYDFSKLSLILYS